MAQQTRSQLLAAVSNYNTSMTNTISLSNFIEPLEDQAVRLELSTIVTNLIDSHFNKVDGILITDVQGLQAAINSKEPADATILKEGNIVDNLTTANPNAPLSANQGLVLKGLIDNIPSANQSTVLDLGGVNEVSALEIRSHLDNAAIHFSIIDGSTSTDSVWSSNKIATELTLKADVTHTHAQLHDQNTDIALAQGTGNEVTAVDLRTHLDATNNPHSTTLNQTISAQGLSLNKGTLYVSDGALIRALAPGVDGLSLKTNSTTLTGLEWSADIGEANTISSVGTGTPLVLGKSGIDLQIRSVTSTSPAIAIAPNGNQVEWTLQTNQIDHQQLLGAGTNTHAQIDAHIAAANPHGITFDLLSPANASGDLVVYNGSSSVRFGVGTAGQVLTSSGTGLVWSSDLITVQAHLSDTTNPHQTFIDQTVTQQYGLIPNKGTLLVSNGSSILELAPGTNGQMLIADSSNSLGLRYENAGEINTTASTGTGEPVTNGKTGTVLNFKSINTTDPSKLTVSSTGTTILLNIVDSGIDHNSLSGLGGVPINSHADIDSFITTATAHIGNTLNPHNVTAAQLGIESGATANPQQSSITSSLTTLTQGGTFTPDYTIQPLTNTSPYGFVSADEAETIVSIIRNLQVRVNELESRLQAANILA